MEAEQDYVELVLLRQSLDGDSLCLGVCVLDRSWKLDWLQQSRSSTNCERVCDGKGIGSCIRAMDGVSNEALGP